MLYSGQKAKFDSEAGIEPTTTWFGSLQSSTQQLFTCIYRIPISLKLHINQGFQKREMRVFTPKPVTQKEMVPKCK